MPDAATPSDGALPPPGPPGSSPGVTEPAPTPMVVVVRRPRPRQLTGAWRAMTVTTWVGVFVAYLAVWKASEELGIATWWLGPRSDPQPIAIRLVPYIVTAIFGILASYNVPRMPAIGLLGALTLGVIAVPDVSRSTGLAVIEFTIAGAVVLVSAASFTGMYRRAGSDAAG